MGRVFFTAASILGLVAGASSWLALLRQLASCVASCNALYALKNSMQPWRHCFCSIFDSSHTGAWMQCFATGTASHGWLLFVRVAAVPAVHFTFVLRLICCSVSCCSAADVAAVVAVAVAAAADQLADNSFR